jgi:hypothetical protein
MTTMLLLLASPVQKADKQNSASTFFLPVDSHLDGIAG